MERKLQPRNLAIATSSIRGFWHAEVSQSAIVTGMKKLQKITPNAAVLSDEIKSLEVVWLLKGNLLREFLIINGIAYFSTMIPYSERRGSRTLHVAATSLAFLGILYYELKEDTEHHLTINGCEVSLNFVDKAHTLNIDTNSFTGMATVQRFSGRCCRLCSFVRDAIGISFLDCICCGGSCDGFGCGPF
jgi:hypothetical protein